MEGRIIAIRVSDADFEILIGLKKGLDLGWNQLLLQPMELRYEVELESARKQEKESKPADIKVAKKIGTGKGKGKKEKPPVKEIPIVEGAEGPEVTPSDDVVEPHM